MKVQIKGYKTSTLFLFFLFAIVSKVNFISNCFYKVLKDLSLENFQSQRSIKGKNHVNFEINFIVIIN